MLMRVKQVHIVSKSTPGHCYQDHRPLQNWHFWSLLLLVVVVVLMCVCVCVSACVCVCAGVFVFVCVLVCVSVRARAHKRAPITHHLLYISSSTALIY